jgi:hypothetical protein
MSSSTRVTNFFASTDMTESKVMPPNRTRQCLLWVKICPYGQRAEMSALPNTGHSRQDAGATGCGESRGGISPPRAPRTVREPLDSHGSRCSAVAVTEPPVGKERWIETANALEPISRSLGLTAQAFELAARPADDKGIDPLQGRTQPRPVEVAVVVDPASNVRIVLHSQILQGHVAAMVQRPAPDRPADRPGL